MVVVVYVDFFFYLSVFWFWLVWEVVIVWFFNMILIVFVDVKGELINMIMWYECVVG